MKGRKPIQDEFTHLAGTVSRQRIWQLRKYAEGKCVICGAGATTAQHCDAHAQQARVLSRETARNRLGCKRRNLNSRSYKIESSRVRDD